MNLFLTSQATISQYKNDIKIGSKLNKNNNFVEILKKNCKNARNFLYIANNPEAYEDNHSSAEFAFDAFTSEGFHFFSYDVLDAKNAENAKSLIENADVIFLRGGTLESPIRFFKEFSIDNFLKKSNAIIIGQSAGSMILSENIYQYPENEEQFVLKRFLKGFGFFDILLIPHFNTETGNEICDGSFSPLNDVFIPDSRSHTFLALENGSFIHYSDAEKIVYGNAYIIKNEKVTKVCCEGESTNLQDLDL